MEENSDSACWDDHIPVEEVVDPQEALAIAPVVVGYNSVVAVAYILEEQTDRGKMERREVVGTVVADNSAEVVRRMVADYTVVRSVLEPEPEPENSVQVPHCSHLLGLGILHLWPLPL